MIMIIITIMIINVGSIWLTALNARQIKVSSGVAYDFDQLIYTVYAPPHRFRPLSYPPRPGPQIFSLAPPRENKFKQQFPSLEQF